jgi:hypothetical protein
MTAHVTGLREMCRRLRELEGTIASQRKLVANLEARGLDSAGERELLARLLSDLDTMLAGRDLPGGMHGTVAVDPDQSRQASRI